MRCLECGAEFDELNESQPVCQACGTPPGTGRDDDDVSALLDEAALAAAVHVDPRSMPSPSRRASHYLDVARAAAHQRRTRQRATELLVQAERLAPQYVRAHPGAREAVSELLVAAGGRELRGLAHRVGVIP